MESRWDESELFWRDCEMSNDFLEARSVTSFSVAKRTLPVTHPFRHGLLVDLSDRKSERGVMLMERLMGGAAGETHRNPPP